MRRSSRVLWAIALMAASCWLVQLSPAVAEDPLPWIPGTNPIIVLDSTCFTSSGPIPEQLCWKNAPCQDNKIPDCVPHKRLKGIAFRYFGKCGYAYPYGCIRYDEWPCAQLMTYSDDACMLKTGCVIFIMVGPNHCDPDTFKK